MVSEKKRKKRLIILCILGGLIFFNFPICIPTKDGSTTYFSLSASYYIREYSAFDDSPQISKVDYDYNDDYYSRIGKKVCIFGFPVYDDSYLDPTPPDPLPYEEELKEIISEVKADKSRAAVTHIKIEDKASPKTAYFQIKNVKDREQADEIYEIFRRYLEDHPESFLNDGFKLTIDMERNFEYSFNANDPDNVTVWES